MGEPRHKGNNMNIFDNVHTGKSNPTVEGDTRSTGHKRVYFYKRKEDNMIFAIDNEVQASHLHRQKQFPQMYHYLGWTTAEDYKKNMNLFLNKIQNVIDSEVREKNIANDQAEEYRYKRRVDLMRKNSDKIEKFIIDEAKKANQNPESNETPRDFRIMGLDGLPNQNSALVGQLKSLPE